MYSKTFLQLDDKFQFVGKLRRTKNRNLRESNLMFKETGVSKRKLTVFFVTLSLSLCNRTHAYVPHPSNLTKL